MNLKRTRARPRTFIFAMPAIDLPPAEGLLDWLAFAAEGLQVRKRNGRKRALGMRAPLGVTCRPNERWSLDFVSDSFTDGRRFRILAVADDCTRECLGLVADTSLSGGRVARELDAIIALAPPAPAGALARARQLRREWR